MPSPIQISGTASPRLAGSEAREAREASEAGGNRLERFFPDVIVTTARARQTARPPSPFRDILTGGVDLLIRGAEVATSVVAGPVMAAAVREVGLGATSVLAGAAQPLVPRAQGSQARGPQAQGGVMGSAVGVGSGAMPASLASPGNDQTDLATMQAMQRDSQLFNLQLLELQEDVQQENRRFTTVSNVLRAKHDTAKAAVANIRG